MANLTDADKVLRNDTGKDIVTQLTAIKTAIENGGGGSGASTVSQLTDVLLSQNIPDGDVLVRDNNLTGGKLWKNATITVELTQAEYDQLVADDDVLPDVNYYITDAPSMQGTSADLSYDGTTTSTYAKISDNADRIEALETRNNVKYYTTASQKLNSLTWTQSAAGVYYTVIDLSALIPDATLILSVSICGWNVIRSSDNLTPFINANDKKIGIMANTNSFSSADSSLTFRVIYI